MKFASDIKAIITFLHVQASYPIPYAGLGEITDSYAYRELAQRIEAAAKEVINAATQKAKAAAVGCTGIVVRNRSISTAVIEQAKKSPAATMIYMASHGRDSVNVLTLGCETQHVLSRSTLPVLDYKEPS